MKTIQSILFALVITSVISCSKKSATPDIPLDFTYSIARNIVPANVQFSNGYNYSGATYQWNFGDNSSSTDANPQHTYTKAGSYTVSLTISNGSQSLHGSKTVVINAPTKATVLSIKLENINLLDANGNFYGGSSGANIYMYLVNSKGTIITYGTVSSRITSNVQFPLLWNLPVPYTVTDLNEKYSIRFYDVEGNTQTFMSGYSFAFGDFSADSYPVNGTIESSSNILKVQFALDWQ